MLSSKKSTINDIDNEIIQENASSKTSNSIGELFADIDLSDDMQVDFNKESSQSLLTGCKMEKPSSQGLLEEDEIDVVNGSPVNISGNLTLEEIYQDDIIDVVTLPDIPLDLQDLVYPTPEQTAAIYSEDPTEEEIDVVNLPPSEINDDTPLSSLLNNNNNELPRVRRAPSPKRRRIQEANASPLEFDENAPLSTYLNRNVVNITPNNNNQHGDSNQTNTVTSSNRLTRRRQNIVNRILNSEDEIIDVVNLTEERIADFSPLGIVLSQRRGTRIRRNRNITVCEDIIEITDSPVVPKPKVIPEVINIDDDEEQEIRQSPLGNCPVCFEYLEKGEIMSTVCGHVFCTICIKTVIKTTKKCPKCRKHLTMKNIHPLFL